MTLNSTSAIPPVSTRVGNFFGECIEKGVTSYGWLENSLISKIDTFADSSEELRKHITLVKTNQHKIMNALGGVASFYNFYTSPVFFLTGAILGILASTTPAFVSIDTLQGRELFHWKTGENDSAGHEAQRVQFAIAAINCIVGRTLADDAAFGLVSGILAGNSFFHHFKENPMIKSTIGALGTSLGTFVQNFFSPLEEAEKTIPV
jgi:hypothetical protein